MIPEDVTLNIKFGWYCLHAEYNSFAVRKNLFFKGIWLKFSGGSIFAPVGRRCFRESRNVAFLRIGKTGVEAGKPLVCLDRLGGEVRLWDLLDLLDLVNPLMGSILPDHMDTQSGQPPPHTGARRPTDESHLLYR